PARMLLTRVVAQDGEHGDVRLRRDAGADRVHEPLPTLDRQSIEHGRSRRFQRRPVAELWHGVVAQPVQTHVQETVHPGPPQCFTMSASSSASRLAPPTSAPSISGCAMKSRMLPAFTLPPY